MVFELLAWLAVIVLGIMVLSFVVNLIVGGVMYYKTRKLRQEAWKDFNKTIDEMFKD
jgi:lipopolysaccharide export LptBFGC system permease protein LptF